jgi:hypothetical protein
VSPTVSWTAQLRNPILALEYDDGSYSYIPFVFPHIPGLVNVNNTSTPDEIGLRFKLPFPARLSGCWLNLDADGDYNINVYDSDGATKICGTPLAIDKDLRLGTSGGFVWHRFTSTANLVKDTYYRIVFEPSSATNIQLYYFDFPSASAMDQTEGGQEFHYTAAKDPDAEGDWTQTLTRRPHMGLYMDAFDDGVGGGSSGEPGNLLGGLFQ